MNNYDIHSLHFYDTKPDGAIVEINLLGMLDTLAQSNSYNIAPKLIKYILEHLDENKTFIHSTSDVALALNINVKKVERYMKGLVQKKFLLKRDNGYKVSPQFIEI